MYLKKLFFLIFLIFFFSANASAADYASKAEMEMIKKEMAELKALVGELKSVIITQSETINELKEDEHTKEVAGKDPDDDDEHVGETAGKDHDDLDLEGLISKIKPQIEIAGDFVTNLSDDHHLSTENDRFSLRGVDVAFSGEIDGVGKGYINLAYHNGDVILEEATLDIYNLLPFETDVRLGKFRVNYGLLNMVHPHALPQVDYPAIYRAYLGHEGYIDEGVGIAGSFPSLWSSDFEYTLQVMNGSPDIHAHEEDEEDHEEDETGRLKDYNDLVYVAKLNNTIKPSDNMNIKWGFSALTGKFTHDFTSDLTDGLENDNEDPRFYYQGADLTLKFSPFEEKYKVIRWQTEVIAAQVEKDTSWEKTYGLYSFIDYKFAPKWLIGARYDYLELPLRSSDHLTELSAYLTHKYTKNNQIRLQLKNSRRNYDKEANEIFLQWIFLLGNGEHDH